jgi:hypothetical protein
MINKKLLLLCIGLIMTTQMIFSQVPSYVPSNGLVGYWPFNGNANDQSGNSNNGTVNGATLTADRFGNANSAYNFDGNDDFINGQFGVPLTTNGNGISLSCWLYLSENVTSIPQINLNNSVTSSGYGLWSNLSASNLLVISGLCGNAFDTPTMQMNANTELSLNSWNFVNMTCDLSSNFSKLYINGSLISQSNSPLIQASLTQFAFGKWLGNNVYLNGSLDDIGIWNRALSQQEITNMYNGVNYSDTCNAVSGSLVNGLVAYYPFCGNANDQSGNGLNGIVNGATLTTDRFGNSNSAYNFDGVNDFIQAPSINFSNHTISCWVNLETYSTNSSGNLSGIISSLMGPPYSGLELRIDGNGFTTYLLGGNSMWYHNTIPNSFPLNEWINLTVSWDGSITKIYKNGILIQTLNVPFFTNNNFPILIGTRGDYSNGGWFDGKIDDIGVWNRSLTQQEITQLYNQNQCTTNITVTDTLIINVGQLSYTNPVSYANNITIYPNPANTQVNISFNNISDLTGGNINIINSLGQQVATTPITLSGTNTTMPLNTWGGTGLYFVQILNAQGIVVDVKKIILQ